MTENGARQSELARAVAQLRYGDQFREMAEAFRRVSESYKIVPPELLESIRALTRFQGTLANNQLRELAKAFSQQTQWHRQLLEQTKVLRELDLRPLQIASASWTCEFAKMAEQMREVGLLTQQMDLSKRLLEPLRVQTAFAQAAQVALEQAGTSKLREALEASVYVSQIQMEKWADVVIPSITLPSDQRRPHHPRRLELLNVIQGEILVQDYHPETDDQEVIAMVAPSTQLAEASRQVLRSIAICNRMVSVESGQDIFKPTTRLLEVYSDLPLIVASDLRSFGEFLDCMYILLYEAAGKDALRYLKQNGGMLEEEECCIIWHIKTLRNKWIRHDADHGGANAIRKSRKQLGIALAELGLNHFPVTTDDYRALQGRILAEVSLLLNRMVPEIRCS